MILTVDFGTSVTKVAIWEPDGLVALGRAALLTGRPHVGWAEQDPGAWWTSMVVACAEARAQAPSAFGAVEAIGCSAARQTFVPVTSSGESLGAGLLWSDRRAAGHAEALATKLGGDATVRELTGVTLDSGSVPAKVAWLAEHDSARLLASDWLLSPRDLVVWRLTGQLATDPTLASRTGFYDLEGRLVEELAGPALNRLPPVVPSDAAVGGLRAIPAAELGLAPGIPVIIGAGDRACEVLGSGASGDRPMVSWGTTANVSVPLAERPRPLPAGAVLTRGAQRGWLLEAGLSAAGSFLDWLARVTAIDAEALTGLAASSPIGARGVVAVPWLDGARAPWWRDDARAAFVGLGSAHGTADLARAVVESVAWEVDRCLRLLTGEADGRPGALGMTLGGVGSSIPLWVNILTAVTGVPAEHRRSGEAASAGAALVTAGALGQEVDLDTMDPLLPPVEPPRDEVERYRSLRSGIERLAGELVELHAVPIPES